MNMIIYPHPSSDKSIVTLTFQKRLVTVNYRHLPQISLSEPTQGRAKRGVVSDFSRQSRMYLLKDFARIDFTGHKTIFITLTYPRAYPTCEQAKEHLWAFQRRIERLLGETSNAYCGYWRMDLQERGAPHFHLLLFDLPYIPKNKIQEIWSSVIGERYNKDNPRGNVFTRIEMIRSPRQASYYVSKYVAKSGDNKAFGMPRRKIGDLWISHPDISSGFNSPSYLDGAIQYMNDCGRWWGKWYADRIPYAAPRVEYRTCSGYKALTELKRLARRRFERINRRTGQGYTLLVDNADRWGEVLDGLESGNYVGRDLTRYTFPRKRTTTRMLDNVG